MKRLVICLLMLLPLSVSLHAQAVKVEVKLVDGNWQMFRGGEPYYIRGAGGQTFLDEVVEMGGNSFRTWSADNAKKLLDEAQERGLTVCMGLWVGHERHGVDYNDEFGAAGQLERFKEVVDEIKDHPALLMWGIGNEVDLFYTNTRVWYLIQDIAAYIHKVDPNHPTMTVTAGLDIAEIQLVMERCSDIDIYGVNSYAGVVANPKIFRQSGWAKPYCVTEWGPSGHWEVAKTAWGVPIEQTSSEKADSYLDRYNKTMKTDTELCIGSYAFLWGNKQETTATWYGLFTPEGKQTEALDALQYVWSGSWPKNRAPRMRYTKINGQSVYDNITLSPGSEAKVEVAVKDPEGAKLEFVYEISQESTDIKSGGDAEEKPEAIPGLIQKIEEGNMTFKAPRRKGYYRLFVFVHDDDNNVAYCNIPFQVK